MPLLKRQEANQHCRTCLINLKTKKKNGQGKGEEEKVYISITNNRELEAIIKKYVDLRSTDYIKDYPQNVCIPCYNKLQAFDKFCKRAKANAEKLHEILNGSEIKEEIEYDSDDMPLSMTIENDKLNESLMETKSSFLNKFTAVDIIQDIKPFVSPKPEKLSDSSGDDNDDIDDNDDNDNNEDNINNEDNVNNDDNDDIYGDLDLDLDLDIGDDSDDENVSFSLDDNSSESNYSDEENSKKETNSKKSKLDKSSSKDDKDKETKNQKDTKGGSRNNIRNTLKCNQCNHRFAYTTTLQAHIRSVHEGSKQPYKCEHCDKSFSFIGGLYTHMKEEHSQAKNAFTCDVDGCDRSYTSAKGLSHHKRVKHNAEDYVDDNKFVCEQCGMVFYQSYNLKNHYRSKHPTPEELEIREQNKKNFECKICKRFFHSQYTLKYHNMQQHTKDMQKFECNVCGRRLAKKFMLVAHMLVHSGPKTPCEHCGRLFIRKFELKEHIRAVHLKLRPFHCRYCPESFACRKTVKHHEYIHTGEKPYVCEVCGQAYRQRSCLKNHRKTHENQINTNTNLITISANNELLTSTQHIGQ